MVDHVVRGPPGTLAPRKRASVHGVVLVVLWVGELSDVIQCNGGDEQQLDRDDHFVMGIDVRTNFLSERKT